MMRFSALLFSVISGLLIGDSIVNAGNTFHRDVVAKVAKKERHHHPPQQRNIQDELLSKAIPLSEYNRQLRSLGVEPPSSAASSEFGSAMNGGDEIIRRLEQEGNNNGEGADDYYMNEQYMYSFSGYSMKYARCQPIQQFSEDALLAGEYSPMVTQDIVVLRLCPYKSCSTSSKYGCHYNYAEYAIGLFDYMRIMLRNKEEIQERTCEWCRDCIGQGRRKLEDNNNNNQDQQDDQQDGNDENQDNNGDNNNNNQEDNNNDNNANNGGDDYYNGNDDAGANADDNYQYYDEDDECYIYGSYCDNYYYDCDQDGENQNDNNNNDYDDYYYNQNQANYIDLEEYYNYLGCTELADNYGGIYFVRPSCSGSSSKISMEVFYDEYCSQSASSVANMDNFEVAFDDEIFEDFYSGECMDCSESNYPPAFNANSYMCNKIHYAGAGCTTNMVYDLFDGQGSDSTECSFIESIRFGTYDSSGAIATEASEDTQETVTDLQILGLVSSALICAVFVVYACYLHHSMTNLLIKSLSHRELLPPSRHNKRRTPSKGPKSKRSSSKSSRSSRRGRDDDDDEWDRSKPLRSPV